MDCIPLSLFPLVKKPFLGPPRIRHGTRCPSLGSDPLGHVKHRPVSALDKGTDRKWCCWTIVVVVAGSIGCSTGRRSVCLVLLRPTPFSYLAPVYPFHLAETTIHLTGFGMILLQTLTRFHVLFTLIAAQMLGSLATIVARATAPDKIGPGNVFPNLCINPREGLASAWFWIALLFQLAVPIGFGAFFRKEQLSKA